jgi:SOS-response transcriptional repressor LexA
MPAAVLSTSQGRYSILEADFAGAGTVAIGVLLEDPASGAVHIRLRRDWESIAGPDDAEVFEALEDDLAGKAAEMGSERFFAWLEDTLSNTIRLSDREAVLVRNFDRTLNRLYSEHVQSTVSARTHVPRLSLRVAAGQFLDNEEVEAAGYEELPATMRSASGLFAAEIVGTSMEPDIPNGSICLFRPFGAGTRNGKLVLVEERGANDRYTVKRYVSEKTRRPDGGWGHGRIRLEPLNPEHQAWDLEADEDRYRVIAEFVTVLY